MVRVSNHSPVLNGVQVFDRLRLTQRQLSALGGEAGTGLRLMPVAYERKTRPKGTPQLKCI